MLVLPCVLNATSYLQSANPLPVQLLSSWGERAALAVVGLIRV